jgi:salicylate 5-hydroxylase large subunit
MTTTYSAATPEQLLEPPAGQPTATVEAAAGLRPWPGGDVSRVPFWLYTDPAVYAAEQERIFAGPSWSYVGLAAEIPNVGDFKRTEIGEKPVVVVRGEDGDVNVVANRCAHRGVKFCQAESGTAKEFVCPYHQWTYDLAGNLCGVPFRRGIRRQGGMPADFDMADHGLRKLAVAERHGVIFASYGDPGALPSLEDYLGESMLGYFDRVFDGRELRVLGYQRQLTPGNWKLMFENIKDPYHASLLHVFLVTFGLFRADNTSKTQMDPTGRHSVLVSQKGEQQANESTAQMRSFRGDFKLADPRLLDIVREFPGEATVVMQTLWPNLIVQQQSNTLALRQLVTRGPGAYELHWTYFGYADDDEEMTTRRLRQANLMGPSGFVSLDDGEVIALAQAGFERYDDDEAVVEMGGRGTEDSDHMVTEVALRAFYSYYREVMGFAA